MLACVVLYQLGQRCELLPSIQIVVISPSEQVKAEEGELWVSDTSVGLGLGYMSQNLLSKSSQLGEATGGIFSW